MMDLSELEPRCAEMRTERDLLDENERLTKERDEALGRLKETEAALDEVTRDLGAELVAADRLRDALEPTKANVDGLVGRGCLDRISALLAIATIRERAGLP
jgi:hypothetical protein